MIRERAAVYADVRGLPEVVQLGFEQSISTRAVFDDDGLLCVYGYVGNFMAGEAIVWLYPVGDFHKCRIRFLRQTRQFVLGLLQTYSTLIGSVDPDHEGAVKWLRWLGFRRVGTYMVDGKPFDKLELRRA